jgi:hypothetical protein
LEQDTVNSRNWRPRPNQALICAVLGAFGAAGFRSSYASVAFALLAASATVILAAQFTGTILSQLQAPDEPAPGAFPSWRRLRVQFSLKTMFVIVIVAQSLLGLSIWNRAPIQNTEVEGYYYGFPLPCLAVYDHHPNGKRVRVDFPWLAVDVFLGAALVVGIALEAKSLEIRRRTPD